MEILQELKKSLNPETIRIIESMAEPRYAYVLYELPKSRTIADPDKPGDYKIIGSFSVGHINVEDIPEQLWKVRRELEINRNKLIAWGKFPSALDKNPARRRKVEAHKDENGVTPWEYIDDYLTQYMKGFKSEQYTSKLEQEVQELKKQIEDKKKVGGR